MMLFRVAGLRSPDALTIWPEAETCTRDVVWKVVFINSELLVSQP